MADAVTYEWYLDAYGGQLSAEEFAGALPAALRCVRGVVGGVDASGLEDDLLNAWRRAVCAAADVLADVGEGQVGGFEVGDYKVTRREGDGVESGAV
ncbi:MAG: hypothetical protein U0J93_02180 [Parolsenella sp.]|uniref:hypothetical protein n=1 Tax=Parolsenella sp. TaxID=2083006 RepID=UPI002E78F5D4|nr:hypothetical protein [Parolsenella sp.]MEE1372172.1 hypothetical protein [Parolsenella sp.]